MTRDEHKAQAEEWLAYNESHPDKHDGSDVGLLRSIAHSLLALLGAEETVCLDPTLGENRCMCPLRHVNR